MADLYDSLFPTSPDVVKIPVHAFVAGLSEYAQGVFTRQNIINTLNLSAEAQVDFNNICDKIDAENASGKIRFIQTIQSVFLIADADYYYLDKASMMTRINAL